MKTSTFLNNLQHFATNRTHLISVLKNIIFQGITTFSTIAATTWLALPVALPPRARMAVNCVMGMACVQVI